MPTWTRLGSSITLTVAAITWALWHSEPEAQPLANGIAIGMAFGLIGDIFMARIVLKSGSYVLAGMAAFGLGHVAYIVGFVETLSDANVNTETRWIAIVAWLGLGAALWYAVVYRPRSADQPLLIQRASLPYALLLATTTGLATSLAIATATYITAAIGAALFLVSDLILAAQIFNRFHFHLISDVVWLTYGPGQMLIVFTLIFPAVL